MLLLALMLVKPEPQLLNLIAKTEFMNFLENKDISAMLMPLDFTNASEMLIAHQTLHPDLNSFLALKELNADAETPSKNAHLLVKSPLALTHLTTNHTPPEPPLEPPEPLELPLFLLTNLLTKPTFAEVTDGIASTSLKDMMLTRALMTLAETLEMVVIVSGTLIPTLDLAEETHIALDLDNAALLLTAETQMLLLA